MWDVTEVNRRMTLADVFLLTHPVWDVTIEGTYSERNFSFLLTHPVWDVTSKSLIIFLVLNISTHTSRVGCDL